MSDRDWVEKFTGTHGQILIDGIVALEFGRFLVQQRDDIDHGRIVFTDRMLITETPISQDIIDWNNSITTLDLVLDVDGPLDQIKCQGIITYLALEEKDIGPTSAKVQISLINDWTLFMSHNLK